MSKLYQIREAVQHVAEAIASVLGVEVTIADDKLYRIAGTGGHAGGTGTVPIKASLFDQVIRSGQGVIIDNPGTNSVCLVCESREHCAELAQVCCPIKRGEATLGVIALVAFTPEQRQALLERRLDLLGFLNHMADLLASKIAEQERMAELEVTKRQLETVLNTVHEGILAIGYNGQVLNLNIAAENIIGLEGNKVIGRNIDQLFTNVSLDDILGKHMEKKSGEVSCWTKNRKTHCIMRFRVWSDSEGARGIVVSLQEMEKVKKIVSRYGSEFDCGANRIVGNSAAIENVKHVVAKAAGTNAAVFFRGESGTGKELFARMLHHLSERGNNPFIAINCAAIPDNLLETELFGYEEGAFTGARRGGKRGKFELANGGTLFLDEIGDMPLHLQAKILRVLQEKRIEKVGGTATIPVDVRIISATNKDIECMVKSGEFRQDLYYRINVFPVVIPPLRQRREDLPELIRYFMIKCQRSHIKEIPRIDDDAYSLLLTYDWPGNIRELENVIEYLASIATEGRISLQNVLSRIQREKESSLDIMPIAEAERQLILAAVGKYGMSLEGKGKAAEALGISMATLYRKLKEYALLQP
jgi:PAS domain S-box-containing protein